MNIHLLIKHRINTSAQLADTPEQYGVELDLRAEREKIILHHDAFATGEDFEEYLKNYRHQLIILNTKCEGMETRLIELMNQHQINDYFFLDLSIPFLIKTAKAGCSKIAVRFSEYEPLELVEKFAGMVEWVWVDCFTRNVLTPEVYATLKKHFKICIVSPELQAHPVEMIQEFKQAFEGFEIDAVCTKVPDLWK